MTTLYDFTATDLQGRDVPLSQYRGTVVMIVNTASQCDLTPQFNDLRMLYRTHSRQGFTILGFPCNQFGGQEPGSSAEISSFCAKKFDIDFPMFRKVDVNGANAHPLFIWLKAMAPSALGTNEIRWNFTKFLVDKAGKPSIRYAPTMEPKNIAPTVERLIRQ